MIHPLAFFVCAQQRRDRMFDPVALDHGSISVLVRIDIELIEARPTQTALAVVVEATEQAAGVGEEFEDFGERIACFRDHVLFLVFEAFGDGVDLVAEIPHLGVEQVNRPVRVPDQVEELALLLLQPGVLEFQSAAEAPVGLLAFTCRGVQRSANGLADRFGKAQRREVVLNARLDQDDGDTRKVAGVVAQPEAEEVEIQIASGALASVEVELRAASCAREQAFERVAVDPLAGTATALGVEDLLHPREQVRVDQGLVSPWVFLPLVDDVSEVVPVAQQLADLVDRDGPAGRVLLGRAGPQPRLGDRFPQFRERVLTGGVEGEHRLDVRGPFMVDGNGVDAAALDLLSDVAVAELRAARSPAVLRLGLHLEGDVGT
nr:hypothetical protein [Glycomyces paridis]